MAGPYPINVNIPAANNAPSDDQPEMQTNFANINSYLQVDHLNPASNPTGTHKQVTFASNNVPTPTVNPPILFTNNQDGSANPLPGGLNQLFFYSGDSAHSQNQYQIGTSGSVLLMQGIILKWGFPNSPTGGGSITDNSSFNFASSFPNNCYSVIAVPVKSGSISGYTMTLTGPPSTTGFSIRLAKTTSGTPTLDYIGYVAIGN